MRKFTRIAEPAILQSNWQRLGVEYENRRNINGSYRFNWPQINNATLNQTILPYLIQQTDGHCSYCDHYHLRQGDYTIDHFKPKSNRLYYSIVCKWDNLFFCCGHCQKAKGEKYSEDLLRPDSGDYEFAKYFDYNYDEHEIVPNPSALPEDQQKAEETIKTFNLNHTGLKKARRFSFKAFEKERKDSIPILEEYNYRFILE